MAKRNLYLSHIIIALTVGVYLLQNLSELFLGYDLLFYLGAKVNPFIMKGQLWRLITPAVLHASLIHIGFNMYALYSLGPSLERIFGGWAFIALYLLGAIWGNTLSFFLSPNPSLGASTAIFGLIAAQGVYIYKNRLMLGQAARPLLMNILMVVLVNLILGLSPGIDNWAHIGGLLGGLFFAWFAAPSFGITENLFGQRVIVRGNSQPKLVFAAGVAIPLAAVLLKIFLF
ncbi:MAG: rhomboid family intramembrane serine protease [Pelolinea sp.]|nr:rhomboid family intramembrane serine protease [Pelolinea sp.]